MSIVRYNPRNLETAHHNLFEEMFNDFFAPFAPGEKRGSLEQYGPKVDIYEKENQIFIRAELPGVKKEDISVDIKGKLLTVSGERRCDETIEEKDHYRRECSYGSFARSFTLPFEVKSENIDASCENGILTLAISRPKEEVSTKIAIK